jgi:hypothetical protein
VFVECKNKPKYQKLRGSLNSYNIQGVSEIRVLILTSGRTRQIMKLFSTTFCKIRKFSKIFAPQFLPDESFYVLFFL